jgi:hypothetical protein
MTKKRKAIFIIVSIALLLLSFAYYSLLYSVEVSSIRVGCTSEPERLYKTLRHDHPDLIYEVTLSIKGVQNSDNICRHSIESKNMVFGKSDNPMYLPKDTLEKIDQISNINISK